MITVKACLSIGYPTATHKDTLDFDEEEFDGMTPEEVEEYINEATQEWADNHIDVSWKRRD